MAIKVINETNAETHRITHQCGCCFEFNNEDIEWENGMAGVICPKCHSFIDILFETNIDIGGVYPRLNTLEFPKHFHKISEDNWKEIEKSLSDEEICEMVKRVVRQLTESPNDWGYYSCKGITVIGLPWEDGAEIIVAKNPLDCICEE